jgi:hypothetical protein
MGMAVYLNNIIIIIKGHIHKSQYSIQGMDRLDNYFYIFMVRLARIYRHKDKRIDYSKHNILYTIQNEDTSKFKRHNSYVINDIDYSN